MRVEAHVVVGKGGACQLEPHLGREVDVLVAGPLGHEHDQPVESELLLRGAGDLDVADVRRVECAAVEADHYSHSSVSPPTSTSSPLWAPAAFSAASSSSGSGARPATRKPRSVLRIRHARRAGWGR